MHRELGVASVAVAVKGNSSAEWYDNAEQVGEEVTREAEVRRGPEGLRSPTCG